MPLQFSDPTREDIFNWGRDVPLLCSVHVGQLPVAQDTELVEERSGFTWRSYRTYAQCTVYIDRDGYLEIEFYEGSYNPEDGERITTYWKQCASVGDAKVEADLALDSSARDADGIISADYLVGLGFIKEIL